MTSPAPHKKSKEGAAAHAAAPPANEPDVHPSTEDPEPPHGDPLGEQALGGEAVDAAEVLDAEPATDEDSAGRVADDVESLQAQVSEYLALAQRTQADFENFRRRSARDAALAVDRGVAKLAKELLPALDHLELALQQAEADSDQSHAEWAKGIRLIQSEFVAALGRVGIQPFSPAGEPFDPSEHEAMAQRPADDADVEAGTVLEVYQQGYRLNGAVLRPARVVVAE